jgi:hypothetical protein
MEGMRRLASVFFLPLLLVVSCGGRDESPRLSWSEEATGHDLVDILVSGSTVVAVDSTGSIVHTHDGGATWQSFAVPAPAGRPFPPALWGVSGSGPWDLWVVGEHGTILRSTDQGQTWIPRSFGDTTLRGVLRVGAETWAIGDDGVILRSVDDGATWTAQNSGTKLRLWNAWARSADDIFVVGGDTHVFADDPPKSGVVLRSTDHGNTWTLLPSGASVDLSFVWGTGDREVYVGGYGGLLLRSADDGATWSEIPIGTGAGLGGIWGPTPDELYVVGGIPGVGGLRHSTDHGTTWQTLASQYWGLSHVGGNERGEVFVASSNGILHGRP